MNLVIKFLMLFFGAGFLCTGLNAQNPFKPSSFPGGPYHPRRMILLERLEHPVLLKISEQGMFRGAVGPDPGARLIQARIRRINDDSLYLDSTGYRFRDVEFVKLPGNNNYLRSDSLKWKVFFPPEDVYNDRGSYGSYMREMKRQLKRDKVSSHSAMSFNNMLKINLTKVANLEIAYDYERRIAARWSFEVELGYQFAAGDSLSDDFFLGTYPLWKYSGVNFVAGPKYYLGKIAYLQMVMIYRYLEMDPSRTKTGTPDHKYGLQYQYRNDLGGAIRFGILTSIGTTGVVDAYLGIGIKTCRIDQYIYGVYPYDDSSNSFYWYNSDHSPDNNHITELMPVINAGIKLGVGF